jgi:hypothetical protein
VAVSARASGSTRASVAAATAALLLAGCGGGDEPKQPLPNAPSKITITSPAFDDGGKIPKRYTCDGAGGSPALRWSGVPAQAKALTLEMVDTTKNFVHWTVLDIDADAKGVGAGQVPQGGVETKNSFGKRGWGGPCPPGGDDPHSYVFTLYALSKPLGLGAGASADDVRSKLGGAAIAKGTLTGRFR